MVDKILFEGVLMTRVYDVFDKFSILNIVIGLLLGVYLSINYASTNIWFVSVPLILIIGLVMTLPPIIDYFNRKGKFNDNTSASALLEAFLLNVAMIAVCSAFGFAICSLLNV